jgi:hypothetical protein
VVEVSEDGQPSGEVQFRGGEIWYQSPNLPVFMVAHAIGTFREALGKLRDPPQ